MHSGRSYRLVVFKLFRHMPGPVPGHFWIIFSQKYEETNNQSKSTIVLKAHKIQSGQKAAEMEGLL